MTANKGNHNISVESTRSCKKKPRN